MKKLDLKPRDYIGLVIIFLLGLYFFNFNGKLRALENNQTVDIVNSKVQLEEGNNVNDFITLYFSDNNVEYLIGEKRNLKDLTPLKAIQALLEGPRDKGLTSVLPEKLEVYGVSVKDGIAYVYLHESVPFYQHGNYSSGAVTGHFVQSICATLILHEPFGIKQVKLEGNVEELLYGVVPNSLHDVNMNLIRDKSVKTDSTSTEPSDYTKGGDAIDLRVQDFFPQKSMKKYFSGGFENGGFTESIDKFAGDKVQVKGLNTGIGFAYVYQITEEYIRRIFRTEEGDGKFKDDYIGTTEDNSNDIILKAPLVVGTKWTNDTEGNCEITGVNVKVQTPAGTFSAVEVTVTYTNKEIVSKHYYAKDLGLVKNSIILSEGLTLDDLLIKVESMSDISTMTIKAPPKVEAINGKDEEEEK